ncbi:MAG: peptidyl-tRNA hydrolase [Candidatus Nanoarchaeia archaeon]|nr:peptidyl-tRNA hydrolase [Candidatus Nanoarchaeia archaeon]
MFKQLIVVRNDLGGNETFKNEQIMNASLSAGAQTLNLKKFWFDIWVANSRPKDVISVNINVLNALEKELKSMNLPFAYSFLKQNPVSLGIGPASEATIEKIKETINSLNKTE